MKRLVKPELLDELAPEEPVARRSRRDLWRINSLMRNHALAAETLIHFSRQKEIVHITELGAGDGHFLLKVAQKVSGSIRKPEVTLLDFKNNISSETRAAFEQVNWPVRVLTTDVFEWPETSAQVVMANLFLHHFTETRLKRLLADIAERAELFVAVEPHRGYWPHFCCQWLWALGCNFVTQHDALVSVRAGFQGRELSQLWPTGKNWELTESFCPPFSHKFVARRIA